MAEQREQRKLAAIFSADMVGYSRLMEADERGIIARQKPHRVELIDPKIAEHHGRIVKLMGDGMLVEFASVVEAVECAVEIQRAMTEREADVAEERRIQYRVGVNLGDIVIEGDDIFGDGVNIAARLQEIAEPGGICLSGTAYDQLKSKVEVGYEFLGERQVKNIAEPVRVYRVLLDPSAAGKVIGAKRKVRRPLIAAAVAAGLAVVIAAGGLAVWQQWVQRAEPERPDETALELPDKPSIAVLPFANLSDDPRQEFFVDGITEDLTTDLSKVSGLFVTSYNSVLTIKEKAVDTKMVGHRLGVRYVLKGSVRRSENKIRINVQLIDTVTGGHTWAERYDETVGNIFALQDKVTLQVVSQLALTLTSEDRRRLASVETDSVEAYEAFLRGRQHFRRNTPRDFVQARDYFQKAIELDPAYGRAHAALALVHLRAYKFRWTHELGLGWHAARMRAGRDLQKAWENPTALAHLVASEIYLDARRTNDALEQAKRALALNANDPESHVAVAKSLIFIGRPEDAVDHLKSAMRLDTNFPAEYTYLHGLAYFGLEQYRDAAAELENAIKRNPENYRILAILAAAYTYMKRIGDANKAFQEYFEQEAESTHYGKWAEETFWDRWPYKHERDWSRLREGLVGAAGRQLEAGPRIRNSSGE